jgi:hypothetical protein
LPLRTELEWPQANSFPDSVIFRDRRNAELAILGIFTRWIDRQRVGRLGALHVSPLRAFDWLAARGAIGLLLGCALACVPERAWRAGACWLSESSRLVRRLQLGDLQAQSPDRAYARAH